MLPDGRPVTGFFTSDFTLAEVKALWAVQALPFRDASQNRQHRCAAHVLGKAAKDRSEDCCSAGVCSQETASVSERCDAWCGRGDDATVVGVEPAAPVVLPEIVHDCITTAWLTFSSIVLTP